jgi:integrase
MIVIAQTATPAPRRSGRSEPSPEPSIPSLSHGSTGPGIAELAQTYLQELEHAGRSAHTLRAYRTELHRLAAFHPGPAELLGVEQLRAFLGTCIALSAASRARTQAALASFLASAYRHGNIGADPMARIERVRVPPPAARGLRTGEVEQILQAIPRTQPRDRLLFGRIAATGLRAGEPLALYIEDLDLTPDDEHLSVLGKGERRRTVLLDDPRLVAMLRRYLKATGYRHGPLLRAQKNGTGGPLSYQSANAAGRPTTPKRASPPPCTSSGTRTRQNWSTRWKRIAKPDPRQPPRRHPHDDGSRTEHYRGSGPASRVAGRASVGLRAPPARCRGRVDREERPRAGWHPKRDMRGRRHVRLPAPLVADREPAAVVEQQLERGAGVHRATVEEVPGAAAVVGEDQLATHSHFIEDRPASWSDYRAGFEVVSATRSGPSRGPFSARDCAGQHGQASPQHLGFVRHPLIEHERAITPDLHLVVEPGRDARADLSVTVSSSVVTGSCRTSIESWSRESAVDCSHSATIARRPPVLSAAGGV